MIDLMDVVFAFSLGVILFIMWKTHKRINTIERDNAIDKHQLNCPGYLQNERRSADRIASDRGGE